ncbi:MAG: hypothetical protein AMXMBFR84_10570 [Candidatus Hydrogenedentota bacterium]
MPLGFKQLSQRRNATGVFGVEFAARPGGQPKTLLMRTPEAYNFTVDAALTSTETLLNNPIAPGYYTPSSASGAEFR